MITVLGDALLDVDQVGVATRLAPDAPVPVLEGWTEHPRPGGAALSAALLARDGVEVVLVTGLARDADATVLAELLGDHGVELVPVGHDGRTPVKRRLRAGGQSLLRLDSGGVGTFGSVSAEVLRALNDAAAVLVSDYGGGLTSVPSVRRMVAGLPSRVPVVWDPHPRGARPTPGVRLATPNEHEATWWASAEGAAPVLAGLGGVADAAAALVAAWSVHGVCVTMGHRGALLSHGESSPTVIPAPTLSLTDACGAGDRFATAVARALAAGALPTEAVEAAVAAAAEFLAAGGAGSLSPADQRPGASTTGRARGDIDAVDRVRAAGGTVVATGGCFDLLHAGHVATLQAARALGDCLVVCLNSDASVRRLKGRHRPLVPQEDRARVLAALEPVDRVMVFEEDTPHEALRRLRPDVWVKGGDYAGTDLPESALLREWCGQAVVVPYLQGRSTTRIVEAIQ